MINKADQAESYAKAIRLLLEEPEQLPVYGNFNIERSREFSTEKVIERMKKIYKRLENQ